MLGGMTLFCLGVLLYGSVGQPEQSKPTTPQAMEPVAKTVSEPSAAQAEQVPPTPDALWATAVSRLEQADQESAAAIRTRLATLDAFFGERKKGALAFAREMLGTEAKLEVAASVALIPLECLDELLSGKESGPNRIERFATANFRRHVLEPGQMRKAVDQAVSGYEGDVREIEGRLLVDLRLDLGDGEMGSARNDHSIVEGSDIDQDFRGLINRTVDTGCLDALYSIGGFVASMWASDKLADGLVGSSAHPAVRFGANVVIGDQIDNVLDGAMTKAGYDPEAEIVGRVSRSLDAIRAGIVEDDPSVVERYSPLRAYRDRYPDLTVRTACRDAATVMERAANIGLRRRMLAEQAERSLLRKAAVHKSIFGPDVPFTLTVQLLDPEKCVPREQLLRFAEQCRTFYAR